MDLTDIYGTFHPNNREHTFFPVAHRTFFKLPIYLNTKQVSKKTEKWK